jgi:hypothetical protein
MESVITQAALMGFYAFQKTDVKEISDKTVLRRCFRTTLPTKTILVQYQIGEAIEKLHSISGYLLVYTTYAHGTIQKMHRNISRKQSLIVVSI